MRFRMSKQFTIDFGSSLLGESLAIFNLPTFFVDAQATFSLSSLPSQGFQSTLAPPLAERAPSRCMRLQRMQQSWQDPTLPVCKRLLCHKDIVNAIEAIARAPQTGDRPSRQDQHDLHARAVGALKHDTSY